MSRKAETLVRAKVRKILEKAGWLVTPYPASVAGYRGVADFICCTPRGRYAEIEVKTDIGEPSSDLQEYRPIEVKRNSGIYLIAQPKSLDMLKKYSKVL